MKFKKTDYAKLCIDSFAIENPSKHITIKRYLNWCANSINKKEYPAPFPEHFQNILRELLGDELLKAFCDIYKVESFYIFDENLHNLILSIISFEVFKFRNLNNKFEEYYTSKVIFYYFSDYESVNSRDISKMYAILEDIVKFKKIIEFDKN